MLDVEAMPAPINNERFICEFGSSVSRSNATYTTNRLYCDTVSPDHSVTTGPALIHVIYYVTNDAAVDDDDVIIDVIVVVEFQFFIH